MKRTSHTSSGLAVACVASVLASHAAAMVSGFDDWRAGSLFEDN